MVNLLILSPLALENGRGGEISSMELAKGLNDFFNITFIDTNILIGESILTTKAINEKLDGLEKFGRIKFANFSIRNKYFNFPYPWEAIKFLRQIKKNDVIYTSVSNFKINFLFMLSSLFHRKGRYIVGYRKPLYSSKLFSLYNIKYRLSLLFFSLFKKQFYHHALSQHAKKFLEKFYRPERVVHIVHGIDLTRFQYDNEIEKKNDFLKFCYIGFLDDIHKGVGVLLKAIELLLESEENLQIRFEFCGTGPLASDIKSLEARFPQFITYHGYISNNLISNYYIKNDVFLFSSRREPFPRSIMEALAAKLVIISSKTIGSVELLIGKNFGFFIDDLNSITIKEKIIEVYNLWKESPLKFRSLQDSAKDFVFKNYSTSREINMFKSLIDKITRNI